MFINDIFPLANHSDLTKEALVIVIVILILPLNAVILLITENVTFKCIQNHMLLLVISIVFHTVYNL